MPNQLIEIYPVIPAPLERLPELASNLFFSWHRPTRALFEDLEPELWQQVGGNLRLMLRCINQEYLDRFATDRIYLERYRQVIESFDAYLSAPQRADEPLVAYFCADLDGRELRITPCSSGVQSARGISITRGSDRNCAR